MNQRTTLLWGAAMGCISVMIGAFGAHSLQPLLKANGKLDIYELAVRYQFYHTLALLISGVLMRQFSSKRLHYAALLFLLGTIFFSGSLYALCFRDVRALNFATPLGGALFIGGWLMLFAGILKKPTEH